MNLFFILFGIVSVQCSNLSEIVNTELREFLDKKQNTFRAQSQSNIRQSSEKAKLMDEIISFVHRALIIKDFSDTRLVKIDTQSCPFSDINIKCNQSEYQSFDGSCNNIDNPFYGRSNTPFQRYLYPSYEIDNSPRSLAVSGNLLPHPRAVSLAVSVPLPKGVQELEEKITELFAIFGQFLTHDIVGTSVTTGYYFYKFYDEKF